MKTMRAVFIDEPGTIRVTEKIAPEPAVGEALLKIKFGGICGADLATYTGNQPFSSYPRIPGHEFSAEIVSIGPNKLQLEPGMVVTANPYFNCGTCYSCRRGLVNCCESNQTMGVQRDGAFQEYITMPVDRLYKGGSLSALQLALVEPYTISYHALHRAAVKPGDKVLVIGAGAIGILAAHAAVGRGAEVWICDVFDPRLEAAKPFGVEGIINSKTEVLQERSETITGGNGFDVCVEAVGRAETFLSCIENAAFGGTIILIGNGKKDTNFNHSVLLKKELKLYGSRNSLRSDFEQVIEQMQDEKDLIQSLVSDVYPVEKSVEAFHSLAANDGSRLKMAIQFS